LAVEAFIGDADLPRRNIPFSRFSRLSQLAKSAFVLEILQWKLT
jgi:hypothetical protein